MSIKRRIIFSSTILVALFVTMVTVNWIGTQSVMHKTSLASKLEHETMHLQGIFRGINEFIIDEGEPLSIELTNRHIEGFDTLHSELMETMSKNTEELSVMLREKVDPQWTVVRNGALSFMKNNPWISVDDDAAMLQYGQLTTEAKKLLHDVVALSDAAEENAKVTAEQNKHVVNGVGAVILILIVVLLFTLYRSITAPIKELNSLAKGFSGGDLSIVMNQVRKDEFGHLASYFNQATERLSSMISTIKEVTSSLTTNSDNLNISSTQIADHAMKQSEQTTHAASSIEQMNASFLDVARNTASAAESSKEAANLASTGGQVVAETIEGMKKISQAVGISSDLVSALGERSEQIGEIIQVINDIASQTNLLALNAAIEAARAGEQGRGFAVVADEVRKLAERTASATNEISDMIKGIQDDTEKAVHSILSGTKEVDTGVHLANQAGEALQSIVSSVTSVTDLVQQIATAAEEQSSTGDVIAGSVESVSNLTQQTAVTAQQSSDSAQSLNDLAQELKTLVSGFRLRGNDPGDQGCAQEDIVQIDRGIQSGDHQQP